MIKLIVGPMGSGKSELLIQEVENTISCRKPTVCFKPVKDKRDGNLVKSRSGKSLNATPIFCLNHALDKITYLFFKGITSFAIDEIQFLDDDGMKELVEFVQCNNISLILSGLNQTSEMTPFKTTAKFAMYADEIRIVNGKCDYCRGESKRTICKVEKTTEVLVGDEIYGQTCYSCGSTFNV